MRFLSFLLLVCFVAPTLVSADEAKKAGNRISEAAGKASDKIDEKTN